MGQVMKKTPYDWSIQARNLLRTIQARPPWRQLMSQRLGAVASKAGLAGGLSFASRYAALQRVCRGDLGWCDMGFVMCL